MTPSRELRSTALPADFWRELPSRRTRPSRSPGAPAGGCGEQRPAGHIRLV